MNRRSLLLGSLVAGAAGLFGVKAKPVEPNYESAGKAMAWLDKQRMPWETIYPSFEQEADELRLSIMMDRIRNSPEYRQLLAQAMDAKIRTVADTMPTVPEPFQGTEGWARLNVWNVTSPPSVCYDWFDNL